MPLMVRAWQQQGNLRFDTSDYEGAVTVLRQAYRTAVARRMLDRAAEASATLMLVLGDRLGRPEEAGHWVEHAEALSRAAGTDEALAFLLNHQGAVAHRQGKYGEAREYCRQALAVQEKALGPDHPDVAMTLDNLSTAAFSHGNYEEARRYGERALAIHEKVLGPDHPRLANSFPQPGPGGVVARQAR